MKTLAVLSALATIAIAAPAAENYADSTRLSPGDFTITQQREKKSTLLETQRSPEHLENHASEKTFNNVRESNTDARTFSGFKKPIIVKKKMYHVYRDSEVEQSEVDSQENCRKQMKVKLCDENNPMDKVKSATIDHPHEEISERQMEHSINVAKEAVHTFERDLQKMEHDCAEHNKHRQTTLGSDTQLHQDIANARQALEHIHRKFKNLDTVTSTADESASNLHLKSVKSDEERMIQWKEAGNLYKNVEIAKNIEDNFKSTGDKDESKHLKFNHFNTNGLNDADKDFSITIEDIDAPSRSSNKFEDGMTSIVQDKDRKMEIHSDSLIKDNTENDGDQRKEENLSRMKQKEITEKKANLNKQEIRNHNEEVQETETRAIEGKDNKSKFEELKGDDLNVLAKHTRNHVNNNEMLKSGDDSSVFDNHARAKLENESHKGHSHTKLAHENDQATHESNQVHTVSSINGKKSIRSEEAEMLHDGVTGQNHKNKVHLDHDKFEQRTTLLKDQESINHSREHLQNGGNIKDNSQQMDIQHSKKSEPDNFKNKDRMNIDTQRSLSTDTISKLDDDKDNEKTHLKNHGENEHLRATSDFHKELLNNMDFIKDSHHMALHQPSLIDKSHMMKNEKPELHERLNVPQVHPNSEHLNTMMHLSDSSHHVSSQMKMASMFNNEEPNFNVQFNSPQDFVQQTNVQELIPFRATGDLHENTGVDKRLKIMHDKEDMLTELHDPLKVHRAHSENMRMDGSSQHFNIEKLTPSRDNTMNDQHLSLNEQIRAQQRWAQAKNMNTHQLSPMNTGFEHLHPQDTFVSRNHGHSTMMREKSNIDSTLQPSSFSQMRGAPKMALEYSSPNQWAHNHGAFRSSYGPSMSASYGSAGGSTSSGSAIGVFPNANVGNCAVPILLSCSPSVVSGSLAKQQNAYNAPAYRSEDVNFLKKRGIDIDEVTPKLKLGHTPLGQRASVILEKNNNTI